MSVVPGAGLNAPPPALLAPGDVATRLGRRSQPGSTEAGNLIESTNEG
jgi:hypothetical protein